jgi:hypothetical protein
LRVFLGKEEIYVLALRIPYGIPVVGCGDPSYQEERKIFATNDFSSAIEDSPEGFFRY